MNDPPGALLTDLYQLTMVQSYLEHGLTDTAAFEFFVRRLPERRNFLIAAGLEQALDYLEGFRFTPAELEWIRASGRFAADFADHLAQWRFTGEVWAMPEGTPVFADEPLLRVAAPLPQAQLVESRLINLLHFQTLVASKAVRCVLAAPGKLLVDFGMRRAHGAEAALLAARASYLAGFAGTATVAAGRRFGIPVYGTMAHSYVQAHGDEAAAFEHFARSHPDNSVLLIDTYDTEAAARKVVDLAPRLAADGIAIKGVRLDSGDLAAHARRVREILDRGGLGETVIFSSGNLDEQELARLLAAGAPIDGFGVGTRLDTSADAPYLDCAYKLVEYAGRPRMKRSEGKATWPGRKQVYRHRDGQGRWTGDTLTLQDDPQDGEPLLAAVMADGRRLAPPESLEAIRARVRREVDALPAPLRGLAPHPPPPPRIAPALQRLRDQLSGSGPQASED